MELWTIAVLVYFCTLSSNAVIYDTYHGTPLSDEEYQKFINLNNTQFCAITFNNCDAKEGRRVDGTCNNLKHPSRGARMTPYRRLLQPVFHNGTQFRLTKSGQNLPKPRIIRTRLISDGIVDSLKWTILFNNVLNTFSGEITTIHDALHFLNENTHCCQPEGALDPQCMPIEVPNNDPFLRLTNIRCMNVTRALTYQDVGCVSRDEALERYNGQTPVIDVSSVYGTSYADLNARGRVFSGGLLKINTSYAGLELPPNDPANNKNICVYNRPEETLCFNTPYVRMNGIMGVMITNIWLWRHHNRIATELATINPCWSDDQLFNVSRNINIASFQQIVTYQLMPLIIGKTNGIARDAISDLSQNDGFVDNYDDSLKPGVAIEFIFALRWFHVIQEGRLFRMSNNGTYEDSLENVNMAIHPGILPINRTLQRLTQGTFRQAAGANDFIVDPDFGEWVFGILQRASDILSIDLLKNRDSGLPPYNKYREFCGLKLADNFDDLLDVMTQERVSVLSALYESVDDIDFQAGIWSESPMKGAVAGPTLACIMAAQMKHFRMADRFWFEHPNVPNGLNKKQLKEIRKMSVARLLCDVADEVDQIQPQPFLMIGEGNELTDCTNEKLIPRMNLSKWKDTSCKP